MKADSYLRWLKLSVIFLLLPLLVSQVALGWYMSEPESIVPAVDAPMVNYFAYGSNMNDRYFTRVRGISRYASSSATLAGYQVSFDVEGIPWIEPSFANLTAARGSTAYGVVHQIRADDFDRITDSEGGSYKVIEVAVLLPDGSNVMALTLSAPSSLGVPRPPSRRYLACLHEAAVMYSFPDEVVRAYDPQQGRYIPLISELVGAAIHSAAWIAARL